MYLKKWSEYYITYYTDEAVACWAIEDVNWEYEQSEEKLEIKGI